MDFSTFLTHLNDAVGAENGPSVAYLLRPSSPHSKDLVKEFRNPTYQSLMQHYEGILMSPWDEIAVRYVIMCTHVAKRRSVEAFKEHESLVNAFLRFFVAATGWPLQVLFALSKDLRDLAFDADVEEMPQKNGRTTERMEAAARMITKGFTSCVTDRQNQMEVSRKWGVYYLATQVLKCYFKIKSLSLSKNILRAIEANSLIIPDLDRFPRSHQVAYRYYLGMIEFLNENFEKAEKELTFAFYHCINSAKSNQERVLTFLIALRMLRGHLPSIELLEQFPTMQQLYTPFIEAIKAGDVKAYDKALDSHERRLLEMNLYIVVERVREMCLRGLFRRVWLSTTKSTRIPISLFYASLRVSGMDDVSMEEAECYLANMVYKGYMRGYISHEKKMVVLAATNAFPRPADRAQPFSALT